MSPKSPTGEKTDQETLFSNKMPDPVGLANDIPMAPLKRDMIVEINGDQKTTIRTTTNGGSRLVPISVIEEESFSNESIPSEGKNDDAKK